MGLIPDRTNNNERRKRRWDRVSWWYSLLLVFPLIGLTLTLAWSAMASEDGLSGVVKDAYTGKPVSGATISTANATAHTNGDGSFSVDDPGASVVAVEKPDYESTEVAVDPDGRNLQISLRPTRIEGTVKNRRTGKPVAGAVVTVKGSNNQVVSATTDDNGEYVIEQVPPDATISVSFDGFTVDSKPIGKNVKLDFEITPDVLSGTVKDDAGKPVAGANVSVGTNSVLTASDGAYRLGGIPESGKVSIRKVGYKDVELEIPDSLKLDAQLETFRVKAIYVSAAVAANSDLWNDKLTIADTTEVNAVVLDLKDSSGQVFYDTEVPLASEIESKKPLLDAPAMVKQMHDKGIYAIARIVVFEDPILAQAKPDWAIHDLTNGGLWTTWNGLAWVNAHRREVWQYNIDLAVEAANMGFDEVQLDYIRFPSDGILDNADYGDEFSGETRLDAITGFLGKMQQAMAPTGAYLAVDIFGLTMWDDDDGGIGQNVQAIEPFVDVVCPMIYPSHFYPGDLGLDIPNDHPYEVILWSLQNGADKIGDARYKLRPWLQDFSYGQGIEYGAAEVAAQIQAADEFGSNGWMLWAPDNEYHVDALKPQ